MFVPRASYFFTLALLEKRRHLLTKHIDALRDAFRSVRRKHPSRINAIVVLPDHLHCIWALPDEETDYFYPMAAYKTHIHTNNLTR